ncbi:transposase [Paenibacillus spongiae]|uniref:Transposase n=1 Tax=Paenibacillus spongiae TaxID=2909671 RepID=A0ABY5SDL9_9BACL|nr:transposase [Paenibacillus spongiae]UVI27312.1 transposase [Paenibacillus spongiae]UVI30783.1 transposase [Paenibacillus spongiae]UVI31906.1 transposase [Paenibacillus spongiae]
MGDIRQHFDDEFKRQTVKHMQETGKSPSEVSKELDIPVSTIRAWRKKFADTGEKSQLFVDYERLNKLEQMNRELQEENEILKKAMHFFTKNRD